MVAHASWYSRREDAVGKKTFGTLTREAESRKRKKTFAMHQTRKVFNYWLEPHATATDGGRISSGPAC